MAVTAGASDTALLFDNKGVIVFAGDDADSVFWMQSCWKADVNVDDVGRRGSILHCLYSASRPSQGIVALRESLAFKIQVTELEMIPQSVTSDRWTSRNLWTLAF